MVQEFELKGHLLFSIQNFEQLLILFEIDYLSSFNFISERFQKYLFWACKSDHHTLPCQKLTDTDKPFIMNERWIWACINYYPLLRQTKRLTKWANNLELFRAEEGSWNMRALINISYTTNDRKAPQRTIWEIYSWILLKQHF